MTLRATDTATVPASRSFWRLVFMVLWLVALDQFVPGVLEKLEHRHYEGNSLFRFENSDLFGLGPAVAYLREHPASARRRAIFLGNSMTFGYLLEPEQTMPAQFQRRRPEMRVFNMAINSQELGTSYLVAKSIIDSVDVMFVQTVGETANLTVASLIPVEDSDLRRFHIDRNDRLEQALRSWLGRVWHLYGDNERLQAALFGTSTRLYVYTHRSLLLRHSAEPVAAEVATAERPTLRVPREVSPQRAVSTSSALLADFGELARAHRKRVILIEYEYLATLNDAQAAQFNAAYAPYAEMIIIHVPQALTIDGQHLNAQGSTLVAGLLDQHERETRRP